MNCTIVEQLFYFYCYCIIFIVLLDFLSAFAFDVFAIDIYIL
jgi:hypothetical protein